MDGEQLSLLPNEPLELTPMQVDLIDLSHVEVQVATKQLLDSVKNFGVAQPVLVREKDGQYDIVDGRRRLDCARRLGHLSIPAVVAKTDLAISDVMTLAMNATRTSNAVAEFHAIKRLTEAGASEKEIAGATGMSRQTIKSRQSLLRLTPALMHAFAEGKMTATVADGASKLPVVLQKELATTLLTENKITERDLHEIKTAQTQKAMAGMAGAFDFGEEFDLSAVDYGEGEVDLRVEEPAIEYGLAQELQSIIDRMPQQQTTLIRSLQWVATMLLDLAMGVDIGVPTMPATSDAAMASALSHATEEEEPEPEEQFPDDQSDMPMPWELAADEGGAFHIKEDER